MVNTVRERKYKVRMKPFNTRSPGCSNRIAKKRGTDKVKAVLPATPSKKAAIIKTIVNSPRTRTILEDEGMMKTLTDEMETRALKALQYVAQYPDGTSIRTLETKTQFLSCPFQFSVNEVFRMKAEHFSFKMKVLAI